MPLISIILAHMLRVARVMREEGGDVEHNLPVLVLSVDSTLSSLVVLNIEPSTIPTYTSTSSHTNDNIMTLQPI